MRVVVKSKIMETLSEIEVNDAKKILIGALPDHNKVRNADDTTNNASTDKVIAVRGSKKEVCILLILIYCQC